MLFRSVLDQDAEALELAHRIGTVAFDAKGDNRFGGISLYQFKDGKWATIN